MLGSEEQHAEHFCDMPPLEWSTDEEGPHSASTEHYSGESDPGEFFGVNPFEHGGYNSDITDIAQSYSHQFKYSHFYDTFPNYDSES